MTFDLSSARMYSTATFVVYCSYHKNISIAVADYYLYFYLIVLSPFTALFQLILDQLINFPNSYCYLAIKLSCYDTLSLNIFSLSLELFNLHLYIT